MQEISYDFPYIYKGFLHENKVWFPYVDLWVYFDALELGWVACGRWNRLIVAWDCLYEWFEQFVLAALILVSGPLCTVWVITWVLQLQIGWIKFLGKLDTQGYNFHGLAKTWIGPEGRSKNRTSHRSGSIRVHWTVCLQIVISGATDLQMECSLMF